MRATRVSHVVDSMRVPTLSKGDVNISLVKCLCLLGEQIPHCNPNQHWGEWDSGANNVPMQRANGKAKIAQRPVSCVKLACPDAYGRGGYDSFLSYFCFIYGFIFHDCPQGAFSGIARWPVLPYCYPSSSLYHITCWDRLVAPRSNTMTHRGHTPYWV